MKDNNPEIISFEIDNELLSNTDLTDLIYLQDLKARKLFISSEIGSGVAHEVIHHILQYNHDDKDIPIEDRKPILLYVCSVGGSVEDGLAMIDVIRNSKTPVYTINYGYQYSMGFILGLVGHKRYATANARFLCHDGFNMVCNSSAKVNDVIEFNRKVDNRIKDIVMSHTNISPEDYDQNIRKEWYMFADDAKEYGVIDYIIGVDCGIDEVI